MRPQYGSGQFVDISMAHIMVTGDAMLIADSSGDGANVDCIFCKPDDPSLHTTLCENELFYARFDNYPANPGHVEVVPKRHVESFFELDEREMLSAYALMREAKNLIDDKHFPEAYTIGINDGKAAGRTIDHLHIHLIPRYQGDVDDPRGGIRRAAPNCDPDAWT
ncbi:HIT family protein [Nonomuraea sp. NPDC050547]|uniref:HIT family protein n=1 Tax=Nonomuraea sp. NPDC050547 TaxID=3364368 RepID=UPI00378FE5B3